MEMSLQDEIKLTSSALEDLVSLLDEAVSEDQPDVAYLETECINTVKKLNSLISRLEEEDG